MPTISLLSANAALKVTVPDEWLGLVALPAERQPAQDGLTLIRSALRTPVGSPRLGDLARPGMRAAVIVDDYTRLTPVHLVLPLVLEELHSAGLGRSAVRIVIAPGSHRLMSPGEVVDRLGSAVVRDYEVVIACADDPGGQVSLGETSQGIPAWVNRAVVEADLRIGIGMITPHLDAGFSGGAKIILPGACGMATIDAFHAASAFIPGNQLGNIHAPLRLSLERFVAEKAPLHFIVNLVLALDGGVYACLAGHAVEAHRAGVRSAREVYGVPVARRFPIVIADCFPYDQDLWQSVKGIWCGDLLVEDSGTLIAVSAAPEGSQAYPLFPACIGRKPGELAAELRAGVSPDPKVAATGVMVSNLRRRISLALVSVGLSGSDGEAMHIPLYPGVEIALAEAVFRLPASQRKGCVAVLPYAGVTLPILETKDGI